VSEPLVSAKDLVVGYDASPVCAPATFALRPGRALALVGPNGAGKTTVLKAVLGLLAPLGGTVSVLGQPVDERQAWFRRAVASVLDEDAYCPALTVREHLDLVARGHGVVDAEDVVDAEVDALGLSPVADALPSGLSSGQRRRLLLATAFVRPRRLLVLDEPEQRLDVEGRDALGVRLRQETKDGGAVLLATHDPALLTAAADQVLMLLDESSRLVAVRDALSALGR
jgi:ABC-2 type transport system ATP-binding protein